MARRKFTRDEQRERLKTLLDKAKESLAAYESRLSELDKEREKLTLKIKSKKALVEKYQALTKESQFNVLDEMLRLRGVNIEDVTRAIADGNTEYLLELTELKNANEETGPEPLAGPGTEAEREPEIKPKITPIPEAEPMYKPEKKEASDIFRTAAGNTGVQAAPGVSPVNVNRQPGGRPGITNTPVRQERPATAPASPSPVPPYRTDMPAIQNGQAASDSGKAGKQRTFVQNNNLT